jgi:hypothetical protein
MTFQNKINFFFLYAILLFTYSCQSQSSNEKNEKIKTEAETPNRSTDNNKKLNENLLLNKEKTITSNDSKRLESTHLGFSLVREFQSKEQFLKNRKLIRDIKLSVDKKSFSYLYDNDERRIQLQEPFEEEITAINISLKGNVFSAYSEEETQTQNIYLYSLQGNLIKKLELNTYPLVKYSSNGKFLSISNQLGNSFAFYNTKGDEIASYNNYQKLIKSKQAPLHLVDIAPDKKSFLIFSDKIYLFSNETGKLIWEKESPFVLQSLFLDSAIVIICNVLNSRLRNLKLISRRDGSLISEIKDISKISINEKSNIIFSKNKKYFEYEIK